MCDLYARKIILITLFYNTLWYPIHFKIIWQNPHLQNLQILPNRLTCIIHYFTGNFSKLSRKYVSTTTSIDQTQLYIASRVVSLTFYYQLYQCHFYSETRHFWSSSAIYQTLKFVKLNPQLTVPWDAMWQIANKVYQSLQKSYSRDNYKFWLQTVVNSAPTWLEVTNSHYNNFSHISSWLVLLSPSS